MIFQDMLNFYQDSNTNKKYIVEVLAFLPFVNMAISGLIMLCFHINEGNLELILGIEKNNWLRYHKISSLVALGFILWHIVQHVSWIQNLFNQKIKSKFKKLNTALFTIFSCAVITALLSWIVFPETIISEGLKGIHSKLGFTTVILFFFHIKNYFPWLKGMTWKFLQSKN